MDNTTLYIVAFILTGIMLAIGLFYNPKSRKQ